MQHDELPEHFSLIVPMLSGSCQGAQVPTVTSKISASEKTPAWKTWAAHGPLGSWENVEKCGEAWE
jgi:hypothetical protein